MLPLQDAPQPVVPSVVPESQSASVPVDEAVPSLEGAVPEPESASVPVDEAVPSLDGAVPEVDEAAGPSLDGAVAVPSHDGAVPEVDEAAGPSLDGAVAVPPLDGAVPEVDEAAGPSLDGAVAVPPLDGAVPEPESSRSMKPPVSNSRKEMPRRPAPYSYDDFDDETPIDEPFRWSDAWGLICGLILLVFIVTVLSWAYLEDLREARELEEARARGVYEITTLPLVGEFFDWLYDWFSEYRLRAAGREDILEKVHNHQAKIQELSEAECDVECEVDWDQMDQIQTPKIVSSRVN
eukprot:symbB.v1.2.034093.t1/scaffold4322.1/size41248/4